MNGPVDADTNEFAYVPIPERSVLHEGMAIPYTQIKPALAPFGITLPQKLEVENMHLDPDFDTLTFGDQGNRAKQISKLVRDDLIVLYASLRNIKKPHHLIYAIIGVMYIERIVHSVNIPVGQRNINAHTRRKLPANAGDIVVFAQPKRSGRLERCIPIGEWRNNAYRVREDLLIDWNGLTVKDGYIQRSASLPRFNDPVAFTTWLNKHNIPLMQCNN